MRSRRMADPASGFPPHELLLTPHPGGQREGAGSMKKMLALFLLESRLASRHMRIDWTLVLCWTGIAIALWILLTVR